MSDTAIAFPSQADTGPSVADPSCPACPHPTASHDRTALRFCTATGALATERNCICR